MTNIDAQRIKEIRNNTKEMTYYMQSIAKSFERIADALESKADTPQGHWTKTDIATYRCSECGKIQIADDVNELNFCCCCGSRNKVRR